MKYRTCFLFLLTVSLVILLNGCGKKEKKKEEIFIQPEEIPVEVDIPQVLWNKSLAFVPLESASSGLENESTSREVTERLFSRISRVKGLKVISPSTVNVLESEDLEVDYFLSGEVREEEGRIQVSLRLEDAHKDSNLWIETYKEGISSLFVIEESVSGNVANAVGFSVPDKKYKREEKIRTDVFNLYLEAKSHIIEERREETDLAVQKFKQVLRIDSTFTPALIGLARSYLQIINNQWDRNLVWLELAQKAGLKAIQLDSDLAEAYIILGQVYLERGRFKSAENQFRKAIQISPNLEDAWIGLGKIFIKFGLYEPCLDVYKKAMSLNPANASVSLSRIMVLIGLKRYIEAEKELLQIMRFHPDKIYYHTFLSLLHYYQGDLKGAMKSVEKGLEAEQYNPFSHAVIAMIYAREGKLDKALEELELEVKPYAGNDASLATAVAAVFAQLKRNGQAIQWLKQAVSLGYKEYPWLVNDPNFEELRKDERFKKLMEELKEDWEKNMREYEVSMVPDGN